MVNIFSKKFFQAPDNLASSNITTLYKDEQPQYFDQWLQASKEKFDSQDAALQNYKKSKDWDILNAQFYFLANKIKLWCAKHELKSDLTKLDQFVKALFPESGDHYLSSAIMYSDGKRLVEQIVLLLETDNPAQLSTKKEVIKQLLEQHALTVCGPGVYTNLRDALLALSTDWLTILTNIRLKIAQQFALEYCKLHALCSHIGNEIHYVNALTNYVAKDYALIDVDDVHAPQSLELTVLDDYKQKLSDQITLSAVASQMTEECIQRIMLITPGNNITEQKSAIFYQDLIQLGIFLKSLGADIELINPDESQESIGPYFFTIDTSSDDDAELNIQVVDDLAVRLQSTLVRRLISNNYINSEQILQLQYNNTQIFILENSIEFSWVAQDDTFILLKNYIQTNSDEQLLENISKKLHSKNPKLYISPLNIALKFNNVFLALKTIKKNPKYLLYPENTKAIHSTLAHCIINNDLVSIKLLLQLQFDINDSKSLLLHHAVMTGNKEVLQLLLYKGANTNIKDSAGKTAYSLALETEKYELADLMAKSSPDLFKEIVNSEAIRHALLKAVANNNMPIIKNLLSYDFQLADWWFVNTKDSALHIAVINNNKKIVELLCQRRANPNLKNKEGKTAYSLAIESKKYELADIMAKSSPDLFKEQVNLNAIQHALLNAVLNSDMQTVKNLLSYDFDLSNWHYVETNNTALHCAVISNNKEMVELLCQRKADSNFKNKEYKTAYSLALESKKYELAGIMAKSSPDLFKEEVNLVAINLALLNAVKENDLTFAQSLLGYNFKFTDPKTADTEDHALHLAIKNKNLELVTCLCLKKVSTCCKNKDGKTPFTLALESEQIEAVEIMCLSNPNALDSEDNLNAIKQAIFLAINNNLSDRAKTLLEYNFDINKCCDEDTGDSLLHCAIRNNNLELTAYLLQRKVDLTCKNKSKFTALELAQLITLNNDVVKLIKEHLAIPFRDTAISYCIQAIKQHIKPNKGLKSPLLRLFRPLDKNSKSLQKLVSSEKPHGLEHAFVRLNQIFTENKVTLELESNLSTSLCKIATDCEQQGLFNKYISPLDSTIAVLSLNLGS